MPSNLNLVNDIIPEHNFILEFQFVQHGLDFATAESADLVGLFFYLGYRQFIGSRRRKQAYEHTLELLKPAGVFFHLNWRGSLRRNTNPRVTIGTAATYCRRPVDGRDGQSTRRFVG